MIPLIAALAIPVALGAEMISGRKDAKAGTERRQREHDEAVAATRRRNAERHAAYLAYQASLEAERAEP